MILYLFIFLSFFSTAQAQSYFSNSVIIMNGSNTMATPTRNSRMKGVQAEIDWSKVPELGVPKSQIHTISIINREYITFDDNTIIFTNLALTLADKIKTILDKPNLLLGGKFVNLETCLKEHKQKASVVSLNCRKSAAEY